MIKINHQLSLYKSATVKMISRCFTETQGPSVSQSVDQRSNPELVLNRPVCCTSWAHVCSTAAPLKSSKAIIPLKNLHTSSVSGWRLVHQGLSESFCCLCLSLHSPPPVSFLTLSFFHLSPPSTCFLSILLLLSSSSNPLSSLPVSLPSYLLTPCSHLSPEGVSSSSFSNLWLLLIRLRCLGGGEDMSCRTWRYVLGDTGEWNVWSWSTPSYICGGAAGGTCPWSQQVLCGSVQSDTLCRDSAELWSSVTCKATVSRRKFWNLFSLTCCFVMIDHWPLREAAFTMVLWWLMWPQPRHVWLFHPLTWTQLSSTLFPHKHEQITNEMPQIKKNPNTGWSTSFNVNIQF